MSAKNKFESLKKSFLKFVSGIAFIVIVWLLFFSRGKAINYLTPLIQKIPKDNNQLTQLTEKILGTAVEKIKEGNTQKYIDKGSEFFENSQYAEPGREIRENVKQRVDEVYQSIKDLPAKELKIIKMEIYKRWFEEIATESATQ